VLISFDALKGFARAASVAWIAAGIAPAGPAQATGLGRVNVGASSKEEKGKNKKS